MTRQRSHQGKNFAVFGLFFALLAAPNTRLMAIEGGCNCVSKVWRLVANGSSTKSPSKSANKGGSLGKDGFTFAESNPITNPDFKTVVLTPGTKVKVIAQYPRLGLYGQQDFPIDEFLVLSGSKEGIHVFGNDQVAGMCYRLYLNSIGRDTSGQNMFNTHIDHTACCKGLRGSALSQCRHAMLEIWSGNLPNELKDQTAKEQCGNFHNTQEMQQRYGGN
jgi:hypothetical protein